MIGPRGTELDLGMERDVRGVLVLVSCLDLSPSAGLVGLRRRSGRGFSPSSEGIGLGLALSLRWILLDRSANLADLVCI